MVVANLECPVTKIEEPINKRFIFRGEPEWLKSLKTAGISHLNLANNHSMDQGRNGLADTERNILKAEIKPLGFGTNSKKACEPILLSATPRSVYLLTSLRVQSENWTFLENKSCVCENNVEEISSSIRQIKAKDTEAVVIVNLHWGSEHTQKPQIQQIQKARILIDAGADAIIGHHPHTIQSIQTYKGKKIYYSIGNFIFDQANPINSKGLMVEMEIGKEGFRIDHKGIWDQELCSQS